MTILNIHKLYGHFYFFFGVEIELVLIQPTTEWELELGRSLAKIKRLNTETNV